MKKLMVGLMGLVSVTAMAAASFSYQGVLRDSTGNAVENKNQVITFRLYSDPTTETALWARKSSVLLDNNGLFNIELNDSMGSSVDDTLTNSLERVVAANATGTIYIGLEVQGSSGEIRPRQKVLSVPLAGFAQNVNLAKADFMVTGKAVLNGPVEMKGGAKVTGTTEVQKLNVTDGGTIEGDVTISGGKLSLSDGTLALSSTAAFTVDGVSAFIPKGVIVMWNGSANDVPAGWHLCDGTADTPDLRDRFIVGAGKSYDPRAKGGADTVALTVDQMPNHTHNFFGDDQLSEGADYVISKSGYDATSKTGNEHNSAMFKTTATGGSKAHENRPPYFALCFIMKM